MIMNNNIDRRNFISSLGRYSILGGLGGLTALLGSHGRIMAGGRCTSGSCEDCSLSSNCDQAKAMDGRRYLWQIDPHKCTQCGRCATHCVLKESAVKLAHSFSMCGYCELCFGYFQPGANALSEAAENQICPTGAIKRKFVEEPYFEYTVDKDLCIGCAKCVVGCNTFGNGSLHMQVMHDRCVDCNECAIAVACAGEAFVRVPADKPYLFK